MSNQKTERYKRFHDLADWKKAVATSFGKGELKDEDFDRGELSNGAWFYAPTKLEEGQDWPAAFFEQYSLGFIRA